MANGEIVHEIRSLLASGGKITSATAMRLTLAAVADLYDKVSDLSREVGTMQTMGNRLDDVEKRVNGWSLANSGGVILAAIIAWFK